MMSRVVSVPLSGLTSVNRYELPEHSDFVNRFRPLIGVNFCKLSIIKNSLILGG